MHICRSIKFPTGVIWKRCKYPLKYDYITVPAASGWFKISSGGGWTSIFLPFLPPYLPTYVPPQIDISAVNEDDAWWRGTTVDMVWQGRPVNVDVEARCFIEKWVGRRISCVIFFRRGQYFVGLSAVPNIIKWSFQVSMISNLKGDT